MRCSYPRTLTGFLDVLSVIDLSVTIQTTSLGFLLLYSFVIQAYLGKMIAIQYSSHYLCYLKCRFFLLLLSDNV